MTACCRLTSAPNVPRSFRVNHDGTRSLTAVVLAVVLFSGCARDETKTPTTDSAAGVTAESTAALDPDADRVEPDAAATQAALRRLADRDEALLEMARMAVTRKEQLKVSDDARRILSEIRKESNGVLSQLKGDYRVTYKPRIAEQEQTAIDALNGVGTGEFDHAFLEQVAAHDEADAQLIEKALPGVSARARETLSAIRGRRLAEAAAFRKQLQAAPASRR